MTIKEYWNLIGRETFLALTWERDFSQACNFRRMLMNHKNSDFTQIPGKINFLKKFKTMFLGHIWPFLVIFARWGFFSKYPTVTHNYIWAPNTMLSLKKYSWANPEETYGQTEGRTEGQKDPILYDPSGRFRRSNKISKLLTL